MQSEPTLTIKNSSNPEKNQTARHHSKHGLGENELTSELLSSGGGLGDRTRSARGAKAAVTITVASGNVERCLRDLPNGSCFKSPMAMNHAKLLS